MFKVIIFDLVGIFSEHENIYSIFKKITNFKGTVKSLHAYVGKEYEKLLIGKTTELVFWNKLKKVTKSRKSIDSLKRIFFKQFTPTFNAKLFKEVRKNFKVALLSNFVNSWWMYLRNKFKINFDYELLSSSIKLKKPDSKMFLQVPAFFKVNPNDCVYVSDEASDMLGAKSIGMETLFIPGQTKSYRGADYYYNSIQEFLKILI